MVRRGHFDLSPDVSCHPAWIVSFQPPRLYPNSHPNLCLSTWVSASIQASPSTLSSQTQAFLAWIVPALWTGDPLSLG